MVRGALSHGRLRGSDKEEVAGGDNQREADITRGDVEEQPSIYSFSVVAAFLFAVINL